MHREHYRRRSFENYFSLTSLLRPESGSEPATIYRRTTPRTYIDISGTRTIRVMRAGVGAKILTQILRFTFRSGAPRFYL